MTDMSVDEIVALITKKVTDVLAEKQRHVDHHSSESCGGCPEKRILILGDRAAVPENILSGAVISDGNDFEKTRNVKEYDKIIIAGLSLAQLADAAQGRPSDVVSCAVIYGLLEGIDILILNQGISFKKYSGRGSRALYNLYSGYLRQLQIYGAKVLEDGRINDMIPAHGISRVASACMPVLPKQDSRLITEADARKLAANAKDEVILPAGVILTPSAKDVFTNARLKFTVSK